MTAHIYLRNSATKSPSPPRRGWLRHGNRPGDYAKAPRCGAHTRSGGCCRQPAMKNGRCRMHGGLSTGPRTAEGLARARRARWKHGFCSAETRELRRAVAHTCRALAATTRLARAELRRRRGGGPAGARPAAARPASSGADAVSLGMGFIERILSAAGSSSGAAQVRQGSPQSHKDLRRICRGERRSPFICTAYDGRPQVAPTCYPANLKPVSRHLALVSFVTLWCNFL